jgi:hypothetical protein
MPMSSCEEPDIDFEIVKRFRVVLQANCELSDPTRSKISISEPKSCGQLLGESWPRAIRSGTGRGGDVTGSRSSKMFVNDSR